MGVWAQREQGVAVLGRVTKEDSAASTEISRLKIAKEVSPEISEDRWYVCVCVREREINI